MLWKLEDSKSFGKVESISLRLSTKPGRSGYLPLHYFQAFALLENSLRVESMIHTKLINTMYSTDWLSKFVVLILEG